MSNWATIPGHVLKTLVGEARCRVFDWRHNISTCGIASLAQMTIKGDNARHGVRYEPCHPKFLIETLRALAIQHEHYTFIDLGSGKGRVLLVASEFSFREVIGVEFARELHEIACENIRRYRSASQKTRHVRSVHDDAISFDFPASPLVLFLANPFGPEVLVPILRRLQTSLASHPRDAIIVYAAPDHGDLIERETMLTCIERRVYHNTYRTATSTTPQDGSQDCQSLLALIPEHQSTPEWKA
jgi:predicted RNA methylase